MNKIRNKQRFISHNKVKKILLEKKSFRHAYDEQKTEFQIISAIVAARIENKLTQKKLAKKIGIAQSALARFESGRTNPTLNFLNKITQGLGLRLVVK